MFKNALIFAGAGLMMALAAPYALPLFSSPAPAPPTLAEAAPKQIPLFSNERSWGRGPREMAIPADGRGQFLIEATINGVRAPFLVDTGASYVTISADLAARLGLSATPVSPSYTFQTANGMVRSYGVTLRSVDLGPVALADVDAAVNPNMGGLNLLGANFLKRLDSVEQRGGALVLRQ